jgi:hypothetical protein
MCMYMHVHTHTHTHTHNILTSSYNSAVRTCMHIHTYTHTHIHIQKCIIKYSPHHTIAMLQARCHPAMKSALERRLTMNIWEISESALHATDPKRLVGCMAKTSMCVHLLLLLASWTAVRCSMFAGSGVGGDATTMKMLSRRGDSHATAEPPAGRSPCFVDSPSKNAGPPRPLPESVQTIKACIYMPNKELFCGSETKISHVLRSVRYTEIFRLFASWEDACLCCSDMKLC